MGACGTTDNLYLGLYMPRYYRSERRREGALWRTTAGAEQLARSLTVMIMSFHK